MSYELSRKIAELPIVLEGPGFVLVICGKYGIYGKFVLENRKQRKSWAQVIKIIPLQDQRFDIQFRSASSL